MAVAPAGNEQVSCATTAKQKKNQGYGAIPWAA
jgi:hypothetical protein